MVEVPDKATRRRWRYQFSLRQLLILMAVVAVVTALWTAEQRKKEVRSWPWDPLESTCRHASLSIL